MKTRSLWAAMLVVLALSIFDSAKGEMRSVPQVQLLILSDQSNSVADSGWRDKQRDAWQAIFRSFRPYCMTMYVDFISWGSSVERSFSSVISPSYNDPIVMDTLIRRHWQESHGNLWLTSPHVVISGLDTYIRRDMDRVLVIFSTDDQARDSADLGLKRQVDQSLDFVGVALGKEGHVEWYLKTQVIPAGGEYLQVNDTTELERSLWQVLRRTDRASCPLG